MKKYKSIWVALGLLCVFTLPVSGQHFLSTKGKAIVNEDQDTILLRGMGLGGWMVQEGYMLQTASFANPQHKIKSTIEELIGEDKTADFYEAWLSNHVRKVDIDSLKAWGFNSVRLPMHYNLYTLPVEEEPVPGQNTWLTKGFELTDSLIAWCKQNEMYVILDLHAAPGGQGYDAAISDYDDTKPSLWESHLNRDKMVAFWKKMAERYADEPWIAGYDILNEPNWNLPGNTALRDLYQEITDSIRTVDTRHILFIEGNWFANDFTGLTPPWDDNMVYSPHKYWSFNDEVTMQWVLDMREEYNIPLYLGESGENSNVWFRDAIRLLEDLDIGWAWWPMKKIESIAGPLSVVKTPEYQALLDYWNGNGTRPSGAMAYTTLMEIAEGLKVENCIFQKDVIDAMFRQVYSNEPMPFHTQKIPGVVYATDFDMGAVGAAYYDTEVANYQVSTGNYTSWNNGWSYRNDGVDIETSTDLINTNGYNVGWTDTGEWLQYSIEVAASGVYEIQVRVASGVPGGQFRFSTEHGDITPSIASPSTGDWQNWATIVVPDVILAENDRKLRFYIEEAGFNFSSFKFIATGKSTTDINTQFMAAVTENESTVRLTINKLFDSSLPAGLGGFEILVNGKTIPITEIAIDPENSRSILFLVDHNFQGKENIEITYRGSQVQADDGTLLNQFFFRDVENTMIQVHAVPGKIEAEDFSIQSGVTLENTTDVGGGQNIGYLDPGDYLEYEVNVESAGTYHVDYRTASLNATGAIELQIVDDNGNTNLLHAPSYSSTGGWQNWITTSENVVLPAGRHQLRMVIIQSPFNMNWFEFRPISTSTESLDPIETFKVYPNPGQGQFWLQGALKAPQKLDIQIYNLLGQSVWRENRNGQGVVKQKIDLSALPNGSYFLSVRTTEGEIFTKKIIKTNRE